MLFHNVFFEQMRSKLHFNSSPSPNQSYTGSMIMGSFFLECCIIGSIRMNILMLDTRNVEQTKDVRMYT